MAVEVVVFLICSASVFAYSVWSFPLQLRSEGHGALDRRFAPLALFGLANVFAFCTLLCVVYLGVNVTEVAAALGAGDAVNAAAIVEKIDPTRADTIDPGAIVTSAALLFGLFGVQWWRRIEAGALRQLYSLSLVPEDERAIQRVLVEDLFSPPRDVGEEAPLDQFETLTGEPADDRRRLSVKHRKLRALLELWRLNPVLVELVPKDEAPILEALDAVLSRRLRLVEKVVQHVEAVRRGEIDPEALGELFSRVRRVKPELAVELERAVADDEPAGADDRVFARLLGHLHDYLHEEYDEQLRSVARATARAIMMSGDRAGRWLRQLRQAGFVTVGDLPDLSLDRAIGIALAVALGVFLVFAAFGEIGPAFGMERPDGYRAFVGLMVVTLTLATVTGVMVGGLRNLARDPASDRRPWGWWATAALAVALAHMAQLVVAVQLAWVVPGGGGAGGAEPPAFGFAAVNAIIPFALVLGLCTLAFDPAPRLRRLPERAADAAALGAWMFCAGAVMVVTIRFLGLGPDGGASPLAVPIAFVGAICGAAGAVIGALVLTHVRRVAHASVTRVVAEWNGDATPARRRRASPSSGLSDVAGAAALAPGAG